MQGNITVNGVEYKPVNREGARAVVVIDRGWIFAGDVTVNDAGELHLSRAVGVRNWSGIGFNGMIASPNSPNVTLEKMAEDVIVPLGSVIFRVPVRDDWGL